MELETIGDAFAEVARPSEGTDSDTDIDAPCAEDKVNSAGRVLGTRVDVPAVAQSNSARVSWYWRPEED